MTFVTSYTPINKISGFHLQKFECQHPSCIIPSYQLISTAAVIINHPPTVLWIVCSCIDKNNVAVKLPIRWNVFIYAQWSTYRQCRRLTRGPKVSSSFFCLILISTRWPASSSNRSIEPGIQWSARLGPAITFCFAARHGRVDVPGVRD